MNTNEMPEKCCLETLSSFKFKGLTNEQYDYLGGLLADIGFGPHQIKALISEAKKFGTLRITNITEDVAEMLIEELDRNKISHIIKTM